MLVFGKPWRVGSVLQKRAAAPSIHYSQVQRCEDKCSELRHEVAGLDSEAAVDKTHLHRRRDVLRAIQPVHVAGECEARLPKKWRRNVRDVPRGVHDARKRT